MTHWHCVATLALVAALSGCGSRQPARLLSPAPPQAVPVEHLADQSPLAAGENIRATQLHRGATSSVSLVQIRDREQPHVHTRYDVTVTLASGNGTLWLNGTPVPMRAGDVAVIPRGTPHHFVNDGPDPAAALVVFSPAFRGPDQEPAP